ncbi:S-layer homology domain-containing protein [Sporosarcina sp.]|uniref:S-layer homology domain-containing protein n=1 Tax=Sporosarcina sp. TaxID=49982 RepID=UPI002603D477|nr:S-layer homology domain-containing protein [Sporosarcina sp.]
MKKFFITLGALLLAFSLPLSGKAANTKQFSDVPSTKHFAEAVYELAERNIIGGYPDGTFKPGNSITRGQAAAMISKLVGLDTKNVKNPGFKDVSTANGYYKAIAAMAEKKIINGYGNGRFGPNDPITRAQMASILVKAFDLPRYSFKASESPFTDVSRGTGHDPNILIIYKMGITTGTSADTFSPNAPITRGQAAKMMKATEVARAPITTLRAKDFGWTRFMGISDYNTGSDLFEVVWSSDKYDNQALDTVHLIPLKEGSGLFSVEVGYHEPQKGYYRAYYVDIKEVDGQLKLTLKETDDFLTTKAVMNTDNKKQVVNVALSTIDGKVLSDSVPFTRCNSFTTNACTDQEQTNADGTSRNIRIDIEKEGQYIATLRFIDGNEIRYGIEATKESSIFFYRIRTVEERPSAELDMGEGRHVLPAGSGEIAEVTKDPVTNILKVNGKKEGNFDIKLPDNKIQSIKGINVRVSKIGPIINTIVYRDIETGA